MTALQLPAPPTEWPASLDPAAVQQFANSGWTAQEWWDRYGALGDQMGEQLRVFGAVSTYNLREWLRRPPAHFHSLISPALFQQTVARYGHTRAPMVLNAYAAGATPRFAAAFLSRHPYASAVGKPLIEAWGYAQDAGLDEAAATGWALTGRLHVTPAQRKSVHRITRWTDPFGPAAYLWRLAGFTLEEAITASTENGGPVSDQQLRVMVALNGVVLPGGI